MRIKVYVLNIDGSVTLREEFVPGEVKKIRCEGEQFSVEFTGPSALGRTSSTQNIQAIEVTDD